MKTGLVIYCQQLDTLVSFYQHVFGFVLIEKDSGYALLEQGDSELVILETAISSGNNPSVGEVLPRESTPIKPAFFVDDELLEISQRVLSMGGGMHEPKDWMFRDRMVCDGWDAEGNIFQLRLKQ